MTNESHKRPEKGSPDLKEGLLLRRRIDINAGMFMRSAAEQFEPQGIAPVKAEMDAMERGEFVPNQPESAPASTVTFDMPFEQTASVAESPSATVVRLADSAINPATSEPEHDVDALLAQIWAMDDNVDAIK